MNSKLHDVIITGGGPAGLTAAIYTSRANLNTLVIAGQPSGGQLMLTTDVENFPGFPEGVLGPDLIATFIKQAVRFGVNFLEENVINFTGSAQENFEVMTNENKTLKAKSLIIATGAAAKWLNIESEQRLRGKGVSACATCDGFFFKDKVVAVVGGGDSAMEEATFLTKFASKVYILVRGSKDKMRASKYMLAKAESNPKIEFKFNAEVVEVLGNEKVIGLKLKDSLSQEVFDMDFQGLFLAIGHSPNTEFLKGFVDLTDLGYVRVENNTKTSRPGVFVAGDVADFRYRQAITAAGLGCMAALDVEKFLVGH